MLNIRLIKALWGMEGSLHDQMAAIAKAGYNGVEAPLPSKEQEAEFRELLQQHGLDYIAMIFTGGSDHAASFAEQLEQAKGFSPLFVNAHSAKDSMPEDAQDRFYEQALAAEKSVGLAVGHETHRGRAMFTPWATARLLRNHPELKLTADFSHWCCVCESLLGDQQENLALAAERTLHIHARVGYAQGPQVPHPAAPEAASELAAHEAWWDAIRKAKEARGESLLTVTPEFGPPGYLHTLPFTGQPVSNLWEVCLWMANRFRDRWAVGK